MFGVVVVFDRHRCSQDFHFVVGCILDFDVRRGDIVRGSSMNDSGRQRVGGGVVWANNIQLK